MRASAVVNCQSTWRWSALGRLPGGEFGVEHVEVVDAPVEALAGQGGQLDLGDVEPGAVLGRVVDLQAFGQAIALAGSNAS